MTNRRAQLGSTSTRSSLAAFATQLGVVVVATAIVTIGVSLASEAAGDLGGNIPTALLERDYLLAILWGVVLTLSLYWWPAAPRERSALLYLWAFRLVVTLGAMLAFEQRYDFLDSYSYFSESREIALNDFVSDAPFNTRNVNYIFSALWEVFPPSYHFLKVSCAYVGLIATFIFYRCWNHASQQDSIAALWVIGVTPSIVFWSSIVGKDPLIFLGIAISTWGTLRLWRNAGVLPLLGLAVGLTIIFFIRPWMLVIFAMAVATAFVIRSRSAIVRVTAFCTGLSLAVTALFLIRTVLGITEEERLLRALEIVSSAWAVGGSASDPLNFSSLFDVVKFVPLGVFTALFRPLPGEIGGLFGLLAGVENAFLLIVVTWSVARIIRVRWSFPVVFTLALLGWWSGVYAFLSYQNLGTAVRFKLQVMPFLLALVGFAIAVSHSWTHGTSVAQRDRAPL